VATVVLAAVGVLVAVVVLLYYVGKAATEAARASGREMAAPHFDVVPFADLPRHVATKLQPLRDGFLSLGARELVTYSRRSPRSNYTTALVLRDGDVIVNIWWARSRGAARWLTLLAGWRAFRRELFAEARYSIVTQFPELRRFQTSPVEIMANVAAAGQLEFLIVPESMPLDEALRRHEEAARGFATRASLPPLAVTTVAQFFEIQSGQIQKLLARRRPAS
jgi:hypothetical protein